MTRSSQPVREHISDFDGDFERTLRRKKKLQESNPPSPEPELEEQEVKVEEKATAQVGGEEQGIAMDNRTLKELAASGLDNAAPLCPKTQGTTICGVCSIQGHQSDQCPQLIENG
ncbi:hypothetical protein DVH24_034269 [Malus domestica]|uniref:Uncharacterized protein n=1 Tax=Malus domestica TaxID=3750 RepID=A0A498IVI5_MALDO|nr:hypothetical protein DVH24_034269 [Malus domestica]